MVRSVAMALAVVLLSGCTYAPAGDRGTGTPVVVDSRPASDVPCPVSDDGLERFQEAFERLWKEAVPPAPPEGETTTYEECPTAFRWATSRPAPDGLFLHLTIEAPHDAVCLTHFAVAGQEAQPGPLAVVAARGDQGAGWGSGSVGPPARVQVLGADSNDILWGGAAAWATAGSTGFVGGTWDLWYASQGVAGWDNDFTGGWGALLVVVCEQPFKVAQVEASRQARLFDQNRLEGGAAVRTPAAGASVQDQAEADLEGAAATVLAGALPGQAWNLVLDHPEGRKSGIVLSDDWAMFEFRGRPGAYRATLDKADGAFGSAWWLLMAGADGYGSVAEFT